MKFSEVIGQDDAKVRLRQMVAENRVPHAIMLCGPQGCGKMALPLPLLHICCARTIRATTAADLADSAS